MRDIDELRPLTAGRLLGLWQACREMEDSLERVLWCNGTILAECCRFRGEPVYESGKDALEDLTGGEMERLLRWLAEGGGQRALRPEDGGAEENPGFDLARFDAMRGE